MSKLYSVTLGVLFVLFIFTVVITSAMHQTKASEVPTLRDKLSQPIPMVASFEVTGKHHGVYQLSNVNGDKRDVGDYALEGDYEIGDVVTVLFATEDSTEIAGDVKVGTANELDLPHGRDSK